MKPASGSRNNRPIVRLRGLFPQYEGKCNHIVNGKPCGKPFIGPPHREQCDQHSSANRYRGA